MLTGKPFERELAEEAEEKEIELAEKLNRVFKKLRAKRDGRDHNISLLLDGKLVGIMEVEVISQRRWEKLISTYLTVRWPIAKKKYAEPEYLEKARRSLHLSWQASMND